MIKILKNKSGKIFLRWANNDIYTIGSFRDVYKYRRRVRRHKRYTKVYEFIIKKLALHLIKSSNFYNNDYYIINKPEIEYKPEGFDFYPSCKDNLKQFCHGDRKKYALRIGDIRLLAETESILYLEVIKRFLFRYMHFPFCK